MKVDQLIIIGGGFSIKEGISLGLWDKLQDKFTFGLNYSYKTFESTVQMFVDQDYYEHEASNMANLPLIIGKYHKPLTKIKTPNTILVNTHPQYSATLSKGVYKSSLVGLFALTLGVYLLKEGEIFLLGYDFGAITNTNDLRNRRLTHYYQGKIEHRGIGKTSYYSPGHANRDFGVYNNSLIKIYNVSPKSNLNVFEKIDYNNFYSKLDNNKYDQNILRTKIKEEILNVQSLFSKQ